MASTLVTSRLSEVELIEPEGEECWLPELVEYSTVPSGRFKMM